MGLIRRISTGAYSPVSGASVVAFRVGFGLLISGSALRFLLKGWVATQWIEPDYHLTYWWASWVRPLPGPGMYFVSGALIVLGLLIAAGIQSRLSAAGFVLVFGYSELIDAASYLNHYWFMTLAGIALVFLPAHGKWFQEVPAWSVWVLRQIVGFVYLFAGLAKLNPDWLFEGQPLRHWMAEFDDAWLVGPLMDERWLALGASWFGVVFDCTIVFWLLNRSTRLPAYLVAVSFHVITWLMFPIGVFPWVMIWAVLIFFEPDWPVRLFGLAAPENADLGRGQFQRLSKPVVGLLAIALAFQVVIPLRHFAYDSNVRWSDEGYYLSWRVMLTDKAGSVNYEVTDPESGERWRVSPKDLLEDWQVRQLGARPDLIVAGAHVIAADFERRGIEDVEVRADAWVSINGERRQRYIDPEVDLASETRAPVPRSWILPQVGA